MLRVWCIAISSPGISSELESLLMSGSWILDTPSSCDSAPSPSRARWLVLQNISRRRHGRDVRTWTCVRMFTRWACCSTVASEASALSRAILCANCSGFQRRHRVPVCGDSAPSCLPMSTHGFSRLWPYSGRIAFRTSEPFGPLSGRLSSLDRLCLGEASFHQRRKVPSFLAFARLTSIRRTGARRRPCLEIR